MIQNRSAPLPSELTRWLSINRLATSDLTEALFAGIQATGWDQESVTELYEDLLNTFANGCCFYLASAVARFTGWPIAGLWRRAGELRLVHAVLVNPHTGHGYDILGSRPLAEIRDELAEVTGSLSVTALAPIGDEFDETELATLAVIARGLPWMPIADPEHDLEAWRRHVRAYADARTHSYSRSWPQQTVPMQSVPFVGAGA
ncbi:hypothetical protein [Sphingomonas sp. 3-13AW]|uniref:hypothetical protein n=1 Tax=Sphingomonas sp. 3-13AW TaxID=3050450 RepID=UPI003BB6C26C